MSSTQPLLADRQTSDQIRSRPNPVCGLCGGLGEQLYEGLTDRLWGAPGTWNLKRCADPRCGLLWLDPMPLQEDIGKAYAQYFTHFDEAPPRNTPAGRFVRDMGARYLASAYAGKNAPASLYTRFLGRLVYLVPFRRAALDFSVMYLPAVPGGRLLDVGCGDGNLLKGMADLGWQVEGIDLDPVAVQNAKRKGLNVRLGTLSSMRYADSNFDAITMSHLIEHVHDPLGLLQECLRILKPNGRLSLVTPNIGAMGHRIYRSSWLHLDPPRHLHLFGVASLRRLLQKAGFRRMKVRTTMREANVVFAASESIQSTGRFKWGTRPSAGGSARARVMQGVECALLPAGLNLGEELTVIADKDARI
jgi:2-polyprenyl-3-methyl-5-hydroxy-6-metoxy-1,4-benzoquinol methylase